MTPLAVALALACQAGHKAPPLPQLDVPTPTPDPTTTAETAQETGFTPYDFGVPVDPSVRIVGLPGIQLGWPVLPVPAFGDDPPMLFVGMLTPSAATVPIPDVFVLRGDTLTRGTHGILDVWDGVTSWDGAYSAVAGDVNDDGHLDLWGTFDLRLGPFLGRERHVADEPPAATIFNGGRPAIADIDVDGDGNEDVVMYPDCCQTAYLYYGPFSGTIPGWGEVGASPEITQFGERGCSDGMDASLLRDHLGPGHPAIAVGKGGGACSTDTWVYDLLQPRGTFVPNSAAIATLAIGGSELRPLDDAGDMDGDGFGDVIWAGMTGGSLLKAPIRFDAGLDNFVHARETVHGNLLRAIGDMNGDGTEELLGRWMVGVPYQASLVVVFSPYGDPIDLSVGMPMFDTPTSIGLDVNSWGDRHADLDGDGRSDLIATWTDLTVDRAEFAGEVWIWYGADLEAEWQARHPTARSRR